MIQLWSGTALKPWLHWDDERRAAESKLVSEPPIGAPGDERAQLVEADQRFQAALAQAIAAGEECLEAVQATVYLKRRTKPSR
jgi:hypothetical protein